MSDLAGLVFVASCGVLAWGLTGRLFLPGLAKVLAMKRWRLQAWGWFCFVWASVLSWVRRALKMSA